MSNLPTLCFRKERFTKAQLKEEMPDSLLTLRDDWYLNHPRPASKATYERHLRTFFQFCAQHGVTIVTDLTDKLLMEYAPSLLDVYSNSSINGKIVALKDFLGFLEDEDLLSVKWSRLERQWRRLPRAGKHQVGLDEQGIETILHYCIETPAKDIIESRDFAFLVFLGDTGLRVHEACKLKRGDLDWRAQRGVIVGKGDKQATFRISDRAMNLVGHYLDLRAKQDGDQNIPLYRLPVFARHDDGAGKAVKHMTPTTGRNITTGMVMRVLGDKLDPQKPITPHKFRHYFINRARQRGDVLVAKGLARHESIQTTEGYFHLEDKELDRGYEEMFKKGESVHAQS